MKDLKKLYDYCVSNVEAIGYEVPKNVELKVNGRFKSVSGRCTTYKNSDKVVIQIAKHILNDNISEKNTLNTIYHEIAHAIDGNKSGHGYGWLKIVNDINDCYSMEIQQYTSQERISEFENKCADYKKVFKIKCCDCSKTWSKNGHRAPKWYAHPQNFRCSCGGKLVRI